MRGYISFTKKGQAYWHDINDEAHSLQEMEESYIDNCIKLLARRVSMSEYPDNTPFLNDMRILECELERREKIRATKIGRLVYV